MKITIYTDPDPRFKKDCDEAKRLLDGSGFEYIEVWLVGIVEYQPNWKNNIDERLDVSAAYNMFNHDVPIINVDGIWMTKAGIKKIVDKER